MVLYNATHKANNSFVEVAPVMGAMSRVTVRFKRHAWEAGEVTNTYIAFLQFPYDDNKGITAPILKMESKSSSSNYIFSGLEDHERKHHCYCNYFFVGVHKRLRVLYRGSQNW